MQHEIRIKVEYKQGYSFCVILSCQCATKESFKHCGESIRVVSMEKSASTCKE